MPASYNFTIIQGDTFEHIFAMEDAAGDPALDADGNPWDFNDWEVKGQYRHPDGSRTNLNLTVQSATRIRLRIPPGESSSLEGTYLYDIQVEDAFDRYTIVTGQFTVTQDITE